MGARIPPPAPNARFEVERKRAKQDESSKQQEMQEAIQRRFAAQGLTGSGASVKTMRSVQDEGAKRLDDRFENIDAREQDENFRQQEIKAQRDFQKGEREASQQFASGESAITRELQKSQFMESMGFEKEKFAESMGFEKTKFEEAKVQFDKQYKLSVKDFDFREGLSKEQSKMAKQAADLALEQFDFQKKTEMFNAIQSIANQKLSEDQINSMIGVLGPEIMSLFKNDIGSLFSNSDKPKSTAGGTQPPPNTPTPNVQLPMGQKWVWSEQRNGWVVGF